ncbi:MAG: hypothetical protein KGM24_02920 [Elusimicrobia bacterium]|nr:hypothetical protein [Elusimicrobiota bacterium]
MTARRTALLRLALAAGLAPLPLRARADAPADVPAKNYVTTSKGSLALSGSVYLFGYAPAYPGGSNNFDLYAFILNMDMASPDGKTGLHSQLRLRDTKLRPFFTSNVWFQELYAYRKTPYGRLDVGRFYRKVGLLWDDSFFGDIQYFNGLKLAPDYGVEWVGTRSLAPKLSVGYSAQFFPNSGTVNGSLDGRDVVSDPLAKRRNTATARVVPTWTFGEGRSLALGLSALNAVVDRTTTTAAGFKLSQEAADLTLTWGPSISYVEVLNQNGERDDAAHPLGRRGYDSAVYWLAGTRWQVCRRMNARFNYSTANYVGEDAREEEFVPGLVTDLGGGASLITEFDYQRLLAHHGGPQTLIDRSYNAVLRYDF